MTPNGRKSTTRLQSVFVVVFIVEHALLLAASVAWFVWFVTVLVPNAHIVALMGDGPGQSERGSEGAHPVAKVMIVLVWMAPIVYSIIVPWRRRRLDGVSVAGAVFIAVVLLVAGMAVRPLLVPFAIYFGVVLLPATASWCEDWAVRRAGRIAGRR